MHSPFFFSHTQRPPPPPPYVGVQTRSMSARRSKKNKRRNDDEDHDLQLELFYLDHGFKSKKFETEYADSNVKLMPIDRDYRSSSRGNKRCGGGGGGITATDVFSGNSSWDLSEDEQCPGRVLFRSILEADPKTLAQMNVVYLDPNEINGERSSIPPAVFKRHFGDIERYAEKNGLVSGALTSTLGGGVQSIYSVTTVEYVTAICEAIQRRWGRVRARVLVLAVGLPDRDRVPRLKRNDLLPTIKCNERSFAVPIIYDLAVLFATDPKNVFPPCCFK